MKSFLLVFALIVMLLVVGFVAWSVGASRALDSAIVQAKTTYRLDSFATDYPPRVESNEAAWRVDEVAGRIGVRVIPKGEQTNGEAPGEAEWTAVKSDISAYASSIRSGTSELPEPMPAAVAAFLDARAGDLDELETLLIGGDRIRFASGFEMGPDAPLPNLLGQLSLTRLLAARAMAAKLRGDDTGAWRSLEAAYRLEESLADQPALICRLISLADLKLIAAVARRLDSPIPGWFGEVERRDPRQEMVEGVRGEVFFLATMLRNVVEEDAKLRETGEATDSFTSPVTRPLFIWDAAYSLQDMEALTEHATKTDPCAYDADSASVEIKPRPWWARMRFAMPSIASTFSRANQTALAIEGTEAVLDLKENPDAFVERTSSVCRDESWVASRGPDGSIDVRFTGNLPRPEAQPEGSEVVTEFVIDPR